MTPSFVIRHVPAWVVNGVAVTLGLALAQGSIGLVAGAQAAQAAIATAVCASLADVVTTTDRVVRRVLVAILASTASATLFLAIRPVEALQVPAVALIVFGTMLLQSWGPKAGSVSFAAGLALVFAMSLPPTEPLTWGRFAWGLAGSAGYWTWAVATAWLLQPTWRHFALAATAQDLARLLAAIGRQVGRPDEAAWQSGILDDESALAERLQGARDLVFGNDTGPAARRETAILLHLIDLRDLAMASNLEAGLQPATRRQAELTGRVIEEIARSLDTIATHLRSGAGPVVDPRNDEAIRGQLAELEQHAATAQCEAVVGVSHLLRNKLEVLRSLQHVLASTDPCDLPCEREDLRRYITPDEWRLAAVTANLRPEAPVFRHAVRTCVTATVAYAIARALPWAPHPQWILLTILAVMQGNLALTLLRRNARVLGTMAGCVAVVLLTTAGSSTLFLAACFLVASGVAHAFFGVRYSVTAAAAAVMALLQAHLAVPDGGFSTIERAVDTVAGALLGGAATYMLPTWERRNLPTTLRQAVAAIRAYAAEATTLRGDAAGLPRFARQRAYDAIRALAAIRSRSLHEPADVRVPIPQLTSWLSAAYGVMSGLSNLRLSLAMHGREHDSPAFAAAVAGVSRAVDDVISATAMQPWPSPLPNADDELVLASVPHLLPRIRRTLADAGRVAAQAAQIEALVQAPEERPGAELAAAKDDVSR